MANNKRLIRNRSMKRDKGNYHRPEGAGNYDNMDDKNIVDQINIKVGTVGIEPRSDKEIANKKYVDDEVGSIDLSGLVPYTGATGNVDLGAHNIEARIINSTTGMGTDGWFSADTADFAASNTIGETLVLASGSITDSTGEIDFGSGDLTTTGTAFLGLIDLGVNTIDDADVTSWNNHITHQDVTKTASPEFNEIDIDNININQNTINNPTEDLNIVSVGGDLNLDSAAEKVDITAGTSVDIEALGLSSNVTLEAGGLVSIQETGSQAQFIVDRTDGACCGFFNGRTGINLYYEQGKAFNIATATGTDIRAGIISQVDLIMSVNTDGNISFSNSNVTTTGEGTFGELSVGDEGINTEGKISSNTATMTASSDDYDVSEINTLFITTAGGNVVLGGLKGGVAGQYLYIARKDATNDLTLEHLEGVGTQDIYMHEGSDETIDSWGGFTLICDGSDWYDCSHAKHV